jgi:cyanophycinase
VGLGVDEDTAAFIGPDETAEILGTGAVTVVDPSQVAYCSVADAVPGDAIDFVGVRVHLLSAGSTFNLHSRVVVPAAHAAPFTTRQAGHAHS